ncbi:asparagine synthetase B [[Phormidium] sp. ETS-05]|uniref:asparagine synthetase B family protein n=1 Tax=[Phormidium] sp. ETS-05 TaxID=222819 RepID=UPI0018EF1361|nr:asparagine synthetase B family protein [[Phormidium] sp. ETS-05]
MTNDCRTNDFIGYWGHGTPELASRLRQIAPKGEVKGGLWGVRGVWGLTFLPSAPVPPVGARLLATLSASGLPEAKDAWVEVREDTLILGREPFGRVPLYWTREGNVIWFASRLQTLLAVKPQRDISIPGFYGYTCFSYVPTPLTPVAEVYNVPAGTEIVWQFTDSGLTESRNQYQWRSQPQQVRDETEAVTRLQGLLEEAIGSQIGHLPSEPVGVFLSGGLDSSVVAALLVRMRVQVRGYTLDFGSDCEPEWPYAEQVANWLKIPLVKVPVTPKRVRKAMAATAQALDMPFGDGVTVPLYLLSEAAAQDTSVVFNGEGGDQLFAGWTNKPMIAAGIYSQEHPEDKGNFTEQYLRTFHRLAGYEAAVFPERVQAVLADIDPGDWLQEALDPSFSEGLLHRLRRATLMLKGAQNIHPRATALGRWWGLDVRSPFCHLPLAEYQFQLTGDLFLRGSCEKYILKLAAESWLPPEIIWRQKRGMGVPLTHWCLNKMWPEVYRWLNPEVLRAEGRFNPDLLMQTLQGKFGGNIYSRRIGEILWLLLMWQLWRTEVFGEPAAQASPLSLVIGHLSLLRQKTGF